MPDVPSVELLIAYVTAESGTEKRATGFSYAELKEALKADPDQALLRFQALLRDARYTVREWACFVGADVCGRKFVPALLEAWNDRAKSVQESAMWALVEMDPSGRLLAPLTLAMRKRLLTWDDDAVFGVARLLALLGDRESAPYLARCLERKDINRIDRDRIEEYLQLLSEGIRPTLNRIREHEDHRRMVRLCKLAFEVGSPDTEAALKHLHTTAPDDRCRMIASLTLDALREARATGPGPYLINLPWPNFKDLPKP